MQTKTRFIKKLASQNVFNQCMCLDTTIFEKEKSNTSVKYQVYYSFSFMITCTKPT